MTRQMALGSPREGRRAPKTALLTGLALLAVLGLAATPARAGNELRNGFEDQVGRLLAFQVFHAGHAILYGGYGPGYAASARPAPHPARYAHSRHGHHRHGHHAAEPCRLRGRGHGGHGHFVYRRTVVERRAAPLRRHRDGYRSDD